MKTPRLRRMVMFIKPPYLILPFGFFFVFIIISIVTSIILENENPDWVESGDKGWEEVAKYVEADTAPAGVAALAIRSNTMISFALEDGDYTHIQADNFGAVWAHCINPPETGRVRSRFESNFP